MPTSSHAYATRAEELIDFILCDDRTNGPEQCPKNAPTQRQPPIPCNSDRKSLEVQIRPTKAKCTTTSCQAANRKRRKICYPNHSQCKATSSAVIIMIYKVVQEGEVMVFKRLFRHARLASRSRRRALRGGPSLPWRCCFGCLCGLWRCRHCR